VLTCCEEKSTVHETTSDSGLLRASMETIKEGLYSSLNLLKSPKEQPTRIVTPNQKLPCSAPFVDSISGLMTITFS